jgi:hypothetical protein
VAIDTGAIFESVWLMFIMPATHTLEQYLHGRQPAGDASAFRSQWQQRRDQYLGDVKRLFSNIRMWLGPLVNEGFVNIGEGTTRLTEENLETYDAPELNIFLGDQAILIRAVGTNVFGAYGRVDILGPKGAASMVLENWGHWKLMHREYVGPEGSQALYTRRSYSDFTADDFKNLLYMLIAE